MFVKISLLLFVFATIFYSSGISQAIKTDSIEHVPDIYGGSGKEFAAFFKTFKKILIKNDSSKIANLMFYPLHVAYGKKHGVVKNKQEFLKLYHLLFNEKVKNMIISQNIDSVFSNSQGIALYGGMIWIDQRLNNVGKLITKIMTINNSDDIWYSYDKKNNNLKQ